MFTPLLTYKGRARTAMAKAGEVEALLAKGVNPTKVARKLGIGRSSVYRAMKERKIKRQPTVYRPAAEAAADASRWELLSSESKATADRVSSVVQIGIGADVPDGHV